MSDLPEGYYRTKTGRILTPEDIQALADEAEEGYDVSQIRPQPARQLPITEVWPEAMRWWPDLPEVEEEDG
ncbi:MAG TPA: hypothetical protein VMB23_03425 [Spirochaetia bacterium]|jgi:hypothetical protein|nr:hypothetical protein [Spirochaetia bacterium]